MSELAYAAYQPSPYGLTPNGLLRPDQLQQVQAMTFGQVTADQSSVQPLLLDSGLAAAGAGIGGAETPDSEDDSFAESPLFDEDGGAATNEDGTAAGSQTTGARGKDGQGQIF